mmetsp:Transcript_22165/g.65705  ORF Transcript_22165/g.65705 Transcript_22165/m.65705 type:complete len:220 (+) Transcript_22165:724-1383(+)
MEKVAASTTASQAFCSTLVRLPVLLWWRRKCRRPRTAMRSASACMHRHSVCTRRATYWGKLFMTPIKASAVTPRSPEDMAHRTASTVRTILRMISFLFLGFSFCAVRSFLLPLRFFVFSPPLSPSHSLWPSSLSSLLLHAVSPSFSSLSTTVSFVGHSPLSFDSSIRFTLSSFLSLAKQFNVPLSSSPFWLLLGTPPFFPAPLSSSPSDGMAQFFHHSF